MKTVCLTACLGLSLLAGAPRLPLLTLAASAAETPTGKLAVLREKSLQDDQPCSCAGDYGRRRESGPRRARQPHSSVSGVSRDGVYFIPEQLSAEESGKECLEKEKAGANCFQKEPQGWEQPSSYTASIVFTPGGKGPQVYGSGAASSTIEDLKAAAATGESETSAAAEEAGPPSASQCPAEHLGPPKSYEEAVASKLAAVQREVRDVLEGQEAFGRRQSTHAATDGPCRRGRAPTAAERKAHFLTEFGEDYSQEAEATALRELKRLRGDIYLDYAGSAVYQEKQVLAVAKDLALNTFGNAHSRNPSAKRTDERTREARELTLKFFGAAEEEFAVVFTSGATAAIKLVGEGFPFTADSSFFYLRINHNSVLGVREFAYSAGVKAVRALSEHEVEMTLKAREAAGVTTDWNDETSLPYCLFGFPLKDNFNGTSYPLSWIEKIHRFGLSDGCRWLVLLDVAAAAPTTRIRLSGKEPERSADFLAISFYKIFGHPTGLGALIVKRTAAAVLKKVYWGGGSVSGSLCDARWQKPKRDVSARLEDGTVNFLSIAAIRYGFNTLQALGMEQIERHVAALTRHLFRSLKALRHRNGAPFVLLYWGRKEDPSGGIVTFNLLQADGSFISFGEVEAKTAAAGIHLRTGCFCNPGGCQDFLGLTGAEIVESTRARGSCSDPSGALLKRSATPLGRLSLQAAPRAKAVGAIRVSLGYLSTFYDIDGLIDFLVHTFLWQ